MLKWSAKSLRLFRSIKRVRLARPQASAICYSSKDVVPFGMECISSLFLGKALCPFCKKPSIGSSQVIFPFSPGDALHLDAAIKAINPPPGIQEKYGDAPQRNELKTPYFQGVVTGALFAAT
ncbi:MAG: hypothetical protein WCG31_00350 [Deltaproteobacteria bacterium]